MSISITRVLSFCEYIALGNEAVFKGWYRDDVRMFKPGMAWYQPWYFDPLDELKTSNGPGYRNSAMFKKMADDKSHFLSSHYWNDWSSKRSPICVVCPNGEQWEIDRKSSNGTGWIVCGELPNIIVSPSIAVNGYHGFLGTNGAAPGQFTADIEGRGPIGIPQIKHIEIKSVVIK